ncbi:hypothetical protein DFJ77DRAFT_369151 [Powellomyces hirtus]|nr:hypothetical protein DFJ77DRAFT_369151 [Powellomyces hirtus]
MLVQFVLEKDGEETIAQYKIAREDAISLPSLLERLPTLGEFKNLRAWLFVGNEDPDTGIWIQLTTDQPLKAFISDLRRVVYRSCADADKDALILLRPTGEPSPNTRPMGSAPTTPTRSRRVSPPRFSKVVNVIEPFSQTRLSGVSGDQLVTLEMRDGESISVDLEYLHGFVSSEIKSGKGLVDIIVAGKNASGHDVKAALTSDVWTRQLLRANIFNQELLGLHALHLGAELKRRDALDSLATSIEAIRGITFLYLDSLRPSDVSCFSVDRESGRRERLDLTQTRMGFVSAAYFPSSAVRRTVREMPTTSGLTYQELYVSTFGDVLRQGAACTGSVLAPLLTSVFAVDKWLKATTHSGWLEAYAHFRQYWGTMDLEIKQELTAADGDITYPYVKKADTKGKKKQTKIPNPWAS